MLVPLSAEGVEAVFVGYEAADMYEGETLYEEEEMPAPKSKSCDEPFISFNTSKFRSKTATIALVCCLQKMTNKSAQ